MSLRAPQFYTSELTFYFQVFVVEAASIKLKSMIYTDEMNAHGNFQQLRNSTTRGMDYLVMQESKTYKWSDRMKRIK